MRRQDLLTLFGFNYWANRHLLAVAAALTSEEWMAPSDLTTRDLRATLVHALDVEWSWRARLQKRPKPEWAPDKELRPADYPDVPTLAAHWARDEAEMLGWIGSLDDATLGAPWSDEGEKKGFPLWYFLVHIITHSQQQRSDAALLLTRAGHSPGNIEFLDYADTITA